jgi:choline-sulfatase
MRKMTKPKNIVLLMADQHQADMMGCAGDSFALTPNIDKLAKQGALFERAYCQGPLCMPARASLMTERFVRDHGVFENFSDIPPEMATFPQRLREAGFHTCEIGKMHLWPHGVTKVTRASEMAGLLGQLGFAEPIETVGKLASARYDTPYTDYLSQNRLLDAYREFIRVQHHIGGDVKAWDASSGPLDEAHYVDVWHGRRAADWIRQYRSDKPFFLWVGFPGPHDPYDAPLSARARFAKKDVPMPRSKSLPELPDVGPMRFFLEWLFRYSDSETMTDDAIRAMRLAYYANISLIDDAVGDIVSALAHTGQLEDTWIVYTSDHGELMGEHRMIAKMIFFEQAVRVPLIIRPPGGGRATTVDEPVQLMDLAATFRDIAGAEGVAQSAAHSLRRVVEGGAEPFEQDVIVSENFGFAMFLKGRHKLIVYEDELAPVQLFDLQDDPAEDRNLVDDPAYAGIVREIMDAHVRPFFRTKPLRPHLNIVQRRGARVV